MTDDDFHKLLATISALSPPQLTALDAAIRGRLGVAIEPPSAAVEAACKSRTDCASIADIEARFGAKPLCPRCQSAKVTKWGFANCFKRYRCKTCKATFNALVKRRWRNCTNANYGLDTPNLLMGFRCQWRASMI